MPTSRFFPVLSALYLYAKYGNVWNKFRFFTPSTPFYINTFLFYMIRRLERIHSFKMNHSILPSILILTVPSRYFCFGFLLLLVLAVRIYTLVQLLC